MKKMIRRLGKILFAGTLILPIFLSVVFSSSSWAADVGLKLAFDPLPTNVADQGKLVISATDPEAVTVEVTPATGFDLQKMKAEAGTVTYQYLAKKAGKYTVTAIQNVAGKKETKAVTVTIAAVASLTTATIESKMSAASTTKTTGTDTSETTSSMSTTESTATETSKAVVPQRASKAVKGNPVLELPAEDDDKLGNLWDYNAYLTGQHSANLADTEGALAVKGDSVFPDDLQTFTYGASFREVNTTIGDPIRDDQYVNVLIGGKIDNRATNDWVKPVVENRTTNGKTQGWLVGRMNMSDWIYKNLGEWFSAIAYKASDDLIDGAFAKLQEQEDQMVKKLDYLTSELGEKVYDKDGIQLYASTNDPKVLVLKLANEQDPLEIKTLPIPAEFLQGDRYKQIIVNSNATKIVMNGTSIAGAVQQDAGTYSQLASKVSFYLPNAQSITNYVEDDGSYPDTSLPGINENGADNYGKDNGKNYYHSFTIGSVIAPQATVVYHSGSINGYVFVKNLHQRDGMEIHNFYNPWLPEIDQEKDGEVYLYKEDSETKDALAGAEFGIRAKGETNFIAVQVTDTKGNLTFSNLDYGEYEIIETKAPTGYELSSEIHEVTIDADAPSFSITLENQQKAVEKVAITIHKSDANSHNDLAGAVFGLRGLREHEFVKVKTDAEGNAQFAGLDAGYYEVVELEAPDGYQLDPHAQIIYVGEQGERKVVEVTNQPQETKKGTIQLTKIDGETGEPLAGVEFGVREFGQHEFVTKKTDSNGIVKFSDLNVGAFYTVAELKTLAGYELTPRPIVVKVSETGQDINLGNWSNQKGAVQKGALEIEKTDQDSGAALSGALFGLRMLGQKEYIEKETDAAGKVRFDDLTQGIYEVRELQAPAGYSTTNLVKKVSVGYDEEKPVTIEKWVNVKTATQLGSGKIIKLDENGVPLAGAEFAIRNDHEQKFSQKSVTNDQGEAYFENLPFGKYDVIETKAPNGYQPDGKLYHLYVSNKETDEETITVINHKKTTATGQIALEKRDKDTGKVMAGVVFSLKKSDGTQMATYKTDNNGRIFIKGLPFGSYRLIEKETLPEYQLDPTPLEFTIKKANETQVLQLHMVNVKKTSSSSSDTTEKTTGRNSDSSTSDKPYPKTGEGSTWYLSLSGIGFLAAALYLFYRKKNS